MLPSRINESYTKSERSRGTLRRFGLCGGVVLLTLSIVVIRCNHVAGSVVVLAGLVMILTAELRPDALIGLHRSWFRVTFFLGAVLIPVILGAIFFFVVTPIGLLRRVLGRRGLDLRFKAKDNSYWQTRLPSARKIDYERQF